MGNGKPAASKPHAASTHLTFLLQWEVVSNRYTTMIHWVDAYVICLMPEEVMFTPLSVHLQSE